MKSTDPRIIAIRSNPKVGRGSCASIDECWDDKDLITALDCDGITDTERAVEWALKQEGCYLEQGLNQRWGEDDDPQLEAYRAWKEEL